MKDLVFNFFTIETTSRSKIKLVKKVHVVETGGAASYRYCKILVGLSRRYSSSNGWTWYILIDTSSNLHDQTPPRVDYSVMTKAAFSFRASVHSDSFFGMRWRRRASNTYTADRATVHPHMAKCIAISQRPARRWGKHMVHKMIADAAPAAPTLVPQNSIRRSDMPTMSCAITRWLTAQKRKTARLMRIGFLMAVPAAEDTAER